MAILDPIKPEVLSVKIIPRVDPRLTGDLKLASHHVSLGMLTVTSDDALYAALDEGTKAANIDVVYARSFYAGASHASGPLSGEIIGIIAAADPSEIESGMTAIIRYLQEKSWFYSATDDDSLIFFPHVIASTGRYLSKEAGIAPTTSLAYLIAPPIEAMYAMDAALKASRVQLKKLYPPPSETNFAGGLFAGDLNDCLAAAEAFQETVLKVARDPLEKFANLKNLHPWQAAISAVGLDKSKLKYTIAATRERVAEKPDYFTHLQGMALVPKTHPRIELRGQIDNMQSEVLEAQVVAAENRRPEVVTQLEQALQYLRKVLFSEYTGQKLAELELLGLGADDLRRASHRPEQFVGSAVRHAVPDHRQGPVAVRLNTLRTRVRMVEVSAAKCYLAAGSQCARRDILKGLNRLSSALYVMYCQEVARTRN
jgi:ethanolamine utilization protein EutL